MGLDSLRNIADMSGDPPGAPRQILDLVPGNRLENWEEIRNLRLEYDGPYLRLKRRGGTVAQRTFFGSINTIYPFSTRVNAVLKDFVAVHNTAGDIILWNVTDDTTTTAMTGFPTDKKIQMAANGIFLYGFSYDAGVAKYYDLEGGGQFSWLDYNKTYISVVNYLRDNMEEEENILGFEKGASVIVFPNEAPASDNEIISSADGPGQLDPGQHSVSSFRYNYNAGKYLVDETGKEYKRSQVIGFAEGEGPLQYTIGGSGPDFTIDAAYYPLNAEGEVSYESYISELLSVTDIGNTKTVLTGKDPAGAEWTADIGGVDSGELENQITVIPYSPDLDSMAGAPAIRKLTSDGITTNLSDAYKKIKIYRQYVVLDQLNDGSISIPGKPFQVEVGLSELHETGLAKVRFTVSAADSNVGRRFLCATRWQPNPRTAFSPSTPEYTNSPLFIAKKVDPAKTLISDKTPDSQLARPITEQFGSTMLAGGIPNIFGPGQLLPHSITQFGGSLLHAGYKVSRPLPGPYTDPTVATDENIFVDISQTTQLPNNMALAFQFEYTDGKRSDIVQTEQFLQEGGTVETKSVDCNQVKASGQDQVTGGAVRDGDLSLTYEGETLIIPLTTANHSDPSNVAEAIRQAVVGSSPIRITADVPIGSYIEYTEKRFGEELNGNTVEVENVLVAATGQIDVTANNLAETASEGWIDVEANNLAASPSEGWFDVTANNLAAGNTESHTLTIDSNPTAAIVINDTDTLEQIVDKYVAEINGDATISADWTASKVDNGDGTWRCLIESNVNSSTWDGSTISISGDTDVTVVVESPTSGGDDGQEDHTLSVFGNLASPVTINDTDTLEQIVDKYVAAINGDGIISVDWTASKVDNGDGTWRCLITADANSEVWNGAAITVSGDVDVTVSTESPTTGGSDGEEDHTITIDGNSAAPTTITATDTLEQIVDKYVAAINGDGTISTSWTASKEDLGGSWRCLITSDTPGTGDNGATVALSASGVAEGSTDVTFTTADASGGEDGPGVTFDIEDVTLSGADDPEGTPAEAWIWPKANDVPAGETQLFEVEIKDAVDPPFTHDSTGDVFSVTSDMDLNDILLALRDSLLGSAVEDDWDSISIEPNPYHEGPAGMVVIFGPPGQTDYNELSLTINAGGGGDVTFSFSSPGRGVTINGGSSDGATEGCLPSSASIDIEANNIGAGNTVDHTITVDGNTTAAISIAYDDSLEEIADKYIAAIQSTLSIDLEWAASKEDNGDGTWRVVLTYRQFGTVGDGRTVSVDSPGVTLTVSSPSSGGADGGEIPTGTESDISANLLQIHSLNTLISNIYVLGRVEDGSTTFHLIRNIDISDPEAHGMIVELPNTSAALDEIENDVHPQPTANDIREEITLQNYINVGTPFQEFSISGQQAIRDQSSILRAMPLQFDVDKTQMRYKFLLVTDRNLQVAYLTDTGQGFNKDIEIFYEGIRIKPGTRAGITLVENNRVLMHTEDGIKLFDQNQVRKLIDDREYDLVKSSNLKTAILNRTHNEYWLIFSSQQVLAIDLEYDQAVKTFSFDGPGISDSVREGAYAHDNMIIAIGGDLCYTDLEGTHDDLGEGVANSHYINGQMVSKHLGTPNTQKKILELDVGGQGYDVQAFLDLQKERLESNTDPWDTIFSEDVSTSVEALDISGKSFQFHKRAIMPKIKIELTGNGDGFISHATLKYLDFENRGKAR